MSDQFSTKQLCFMAFDHAFISNEGARLSNELQKFIELVSLYESHADIMPLIEARDKCINLHYGYSATSFEKNHLQNIKS